GVTPFKSAVGRSSGSEIARSTAVSYEYWVWPGSSDAGWSSSTTRSVWSLSSFAPCVRGELGALQANPAVKTSVASAKARKRQGLGVTEAMIGKAPTRTPGPENYEGPPV